MRVAAVISKRLWLASVISSDQARRALRVFAALSAATLLLAAMPAKNRSNPLAWDLLLLSGFATFLAGLLATRSSKENFETMLNRLGRRGVISEIDKVKNAMEQMAEGWTHVVAAGVAISIFVAFIAVMISDPRHVSQRIGLC